MGQKVKWFKAETSSIYLLEGIECKLEGKLLYLSDSRVLGIESEKDIGMSSDRLIIGRREDEFLYLLNLSIKDDMLPVYLHYLKKVPVDKVNKPDIVRYSGRWGELPEIDESLLLGVGDYVKELLIAETLQDFDLERLIGISPNLDVFKLINSRTKQHVAFEGGNEYRQFRKLN